MNVIPALTDVRIDVSTSSEVTTVVAVVDAGTVAVAYVVKTV